MALTEGPFYPNQLPLDLDNDLLIVNDRTTPAVGKISWMSGRVLDRAGSPVRGALVEIWQTDTNGAYIHTNSTIGTRDANFQGIGKFLTASDGKSSPPSTPAVRATCIAGLRFPARTV